MAQKNPGDDDPAIDSIYEVGTVAQVMQLLKLPDGTVKVLVEGIDRAKVIDFVAKPEYFEARVQLVPAAQDLLQRDGRPCPLHRVSNSKAM